MALPNDLKCPDLYYSIHLTVVCTNNIQIVCSTVCIVRVHVNIVRLAATLDRHSIVPSFSARLAGRIGDSHSSIQTWAMTSFGALGCGRCCDRIRLDGNETARPTRPGKWLGFRPIVCRTRKYFDDMTPTKIRGQIKSYSKSKAIDVSS